MKAETQTKTETQTKAEMGTRRSETRKKEKIVTRKRRRSAEDRRSRRKATEERRPQRRALASVGREHHIGTCLKTTEGETVRRSWPHSRRNVASPGRNLVVWNVCRRKNLTAIGMKDSSGDGVKLQGPDKPWVKALRVLWSTGAVRHHWNPSYRLP
ncbi:hypothetical protein NDU88_007066 [Pleurodeles waltl]|uniref:Uncharacterized protein n=1 Tax=Pleurodeles waltl TaxID=8319 RepID=A0AAV7SRG6_PLEWA|nr:hypothetical protein NDU88_007066 [Pleurodeles waltl]